MAAKCHLMDGGPDAWFTSDGAYKGHGFYTLPRCDLCPQRGGLSLSEHAGGGADLVP